MGVVFNSICFAQNPPDPQSGPCKCHRLLFKFQNITHTHLKKDSTTNHIEFLFIFSVYILSHHLLWPRFSLWTWCTWEKKAIWNKIKQEISGRQCVLRRQMSRTVLSACQSQQLTAVDLKGQLWGLKAKTVGISPKLVHIYCVEKKSPDPGPSRLCPTVYQSPLLLHCDVIVVWFVTDLIWLWCHACIICPTQTSLQNTIREIRPETRAATSINLQRYPIYEH